MNTTQNKTTAVKLIESRQQARRVKGGLKKWMDAAKQLILADSGRHFHGGYENSDGILLHELRLIASR